MRAAFLFLLVASSCSRQAEPPQATTTSQTLRLATTTSVQDSGLLDQLLPEFEQQHTCRVDVVAVGTGAALKLGEAGDADVLLVHAREAEEAFMAAGHGVRHEEFMENDFLLLGPPGDPAAIQGVSATDALRKIASSQQAFVSRGDDSGTHQREQHLWEQAGGFAYWPNYLESGQGMGPTLLMADELRAYVLVDRGTYLNYKTKIELTPLVPTSPSMRNPYSLIVVKPGDSQQGETRLADALVEFFLSPHTQQAIGEYRINGELLFSPTRVRNP